LEIAVYTATTAINAGKFHSSRGKCAENAGSSVTDENHIPAESTESRFSIAPMCAFSAPNVPRVTRRAIFTGLVFAKHGMRRELLQPCRSILRGSMYLSSGTAQWLFGG
jgi:hypothetical protein